LNSHLRAILFDIDGTLIDTVSLIVEALDFAFRKHLNIAAPAEELRRTIGTPLSAQMHYFDHRLSAAPDYDEMARDVVEYYETGKHRETPIAEALSAVRECSRKGYLVGLVTSKNRHEMTMAGPRLRLDDSVHVTITSSDTAHPKPAPDPVLAAAEALGVSPDEALFVGDTTYDIESGAAAGARTAAVAWGAHLPETLRAAKPNLYFDTPADLLRWCNNLPDWSNHASQEKD
jgi:pyrophosphatase PpaX